MNGRESQLPRVQGKHLKLGSAVTILVALFSTPGFVAWFQDGGMKAEVAYEVLQAEIDSLNKNEERLFNEMQNLRKSLLSMYIQRNHMSMYGGMGMGMGMPMGEGLVVPDDLFESFPTSADGDGDGDEGSSESLPEPPPSLSPPEPPVHPLEQLLAPPKSFSMEQRTPLPDKLEDLLKKR